jgi:8-oxo-dGTP pyrophosphatase MutT (NUDIX family)
LKKRLQGIHPRRVVLEGFTPAAVLLLLWHQQEGPHLLFIRRSDRVPYHKGEISFPGGRMESGDGDLCHTALRETREEVGVPQGAMTVLGQLDDVITLSKFVVTPYVAALPRPQRFQPNEEVAEIITLPLQVLYHPDRLSVALRTMSDGTVFVYTYQFGQWTIWGATARILKTFLAVLQNDPELPSPHYS